MEVLIFMEDFVQMNMFAWICTAFIIGYVIQYPITGNLHYIPEFQITHLSSYSNPSNWVTIPNHFVVNLPSHSYLVTTTNSF